MKKSDNSFYCPACHKPRGFNKGDHSECIKQLMDRPKSRIKKPIDYSDDKKLNGFLRSIE
jgi:hypothetical protein